MTSVLQVIGDPITEGMVPPMTLHPQDAAELDRIREAKTAARDIIAWETRVARRAVDRGALQDEIADRLGVSQVMVHKILNRDLDHPDEHADDRAG